MIILAKYGTALTVRIPLIKAGSNNFAVGADYTPVAGDTKITRDGGGAQNTVNNPAALVMGNGAIWTLVIAATELQSAEVVITCIDAATKAIEDQALIIHTYGNASARHAVDLNDAVRAGLTALPNAAAEAAGGLYTRGTGAGQINQPQNGRVDVNVVGMTTDVITAAVIADNAIDAGAIAANALTAAKIATDAIGASQIANGAITAAKIATDAIDADALAADALTEIAAACWNAAAATYTASGSMGEKQNLMPMRLKKNTAFTNFMFFLADSSGNGVAGESVTAQRSLDGAVFGACANAVSEVSGGWYKISLASGDLNGDVVALKFTSTNSKGYGVVVVTNPTA
jgi:hypothetical protein